MSNLDELQADKEKLCELIAELRNYEGCELGGPLHIVLDDGNLEVECIGFCLKTISHTGCAYNWYSTAGIVQLCCEIAGLLLCMSQADRIELYA